MTASLRHVVFAGGGTAGHLFPGLAVAAALRATDPEVEITFACGGTEFERLHIAAAGCRLLPVASSPLPRSPRQAWRFVSDNLAGYRTAAAWLRRQEVDVVVGLGGHGSVPLARAAAARGTPLVLLEQNVVPGRATLWLARRAQAICLAFEPSKRQLSAACPVRVTGNPLRPGFERTRPALVTDGGPPRRKRLLVLGGTHGARTLNQQAPKALYRLRRQLVGWDIYHQTGRWGAAETAELYRKLGLRARVESFFDPVARLYSQGDLAISRGGGTTLAELAAAGVPAVVVPYPLAADDHQRHNADYFATRGACLVLDQRQVSGRFDTALAETVAPLLDDPLARAAMAEAMGHLARPEAAFHVAGVVADVATSRHYRHAV